MTDKTETKDSPECTPETAALQAEIMKVYSELNDSNDADRLDFVGSTAQAVAHERLIESKRDDRLFNDHLAQYFVGTKGEKCSGMINKHLEFSFGTENLHIGYTAARTRLINDNLNSWIEKKDGIKVQCVNLGAGGDTRAFWLDSLKKVQSYIEVDMSEVNTFKERVFADLNARPLCERRAISLNFSKESVKDLPQHGFDSILPTCWILEGLIMYLAKETIESLLNELSDLSAQGSYLILNFIKQDGDEYISTLLEGKGWKNEKTLFYGDENFDYGRFPKGNKTTTLGFAFWGK
jgi:methyltransferase (TIGR00027 family)